MSDGLRGLKRVPSGQLGDLSQKKARGAVAATAPSNPRARSTTPGPSSTATPSSQAVANQIFRHALGTIDMNTLRPDPIDLRKEAQSLFRLNQHDRNPNRIEELDDESDSDADETSDAGLNLEARREALAIQLQLASTLFLVFKQPDLPEWGQLKSYVLLQSSPAGCVYICLWIYTESAVLSAKLDATTLALSAPLGHLSLSLRWADLRWSTLLVVMAQLR